MPGLKDGLNSLWGPPMAASTDFPLHICLSEAPRHCIHPSIDELFCRQTKCCVKCVAEALLQVYHQITAHVLKESEGYFCAGCNLYIHYD